MTDTAFTLLNPGPINVSPAVREALHRCVDQCHREPEYLTMQDRVRRKLVSVFGVASEYEAALITGSGTAAMEAMVCSTVEHGLLVLVNGVYGERLAKIGRAHGLAVDVAERNWLEPHDPASLADVLHDGIDTVAVVHHETTTGLLNDIPGIAAVCKAHGKRLIVDSVSGLGGETFDFGDIQPAAVCCTANKCIQGLPGISFVFVHRDTPLHTRSVYMDLPGILEKQRKSDTPFTPAIQVMAALEAALDELDKETVAGRIERYTTASMSIRDTMERLGLSCLLPNDIRSNTITCAHLPAGVTYQHIHDRMREKGFVIYGGQGHLSATAFRVANMGIIPPKRLKDFDKALEYALKA